MRQAVIGGHTIEGVVSLHNGPLKLAPVHLWFSSGKTAWVGKTRNDGTFNITNMPFGNYRLEVRGWGRTTVQLDPERDNKLRFINQIPTWYLSLLDHACVGALATMD